MAEGEGNGVEGGGGGAGEKKVMKFSFSKTKPSNRRPPLPPKGKEKEDVVVEYVTSVDAEAGIVVVNPRAGSGVKVVPKLENSWRPEKRMKNIMMESDSTKSTDETFEMETIDVGPKANVQYGLTLMERVESEGVAEAPRRMSLKELEDQKLREDLTNLPEEATLDQYEELPVEAFGEALLRGMGWEKGKPIGRNSKTIVEPVEYTRRQGTLGLGATPPPPKETNKKYIKPGETRDRRRVDYDKPRDSREKRRDEESRENGRDEYIKPEKSRDSRREEYINPRDSREHRREVDLRESRRDDYIEPRDSRESRREDESRRSRRDDDTESRDSREKKREEHRKPKDSRESRREEFSETRDSREKRRDDYSRSDEHRESRREQKRSNRR
ncbi:hypothetical protein M758_9G185100 [Ceratodon purpureus]|nr:hypothetical protein M758_9G185100 [Ceratodon purpureus]